MTDQRHHAFIRPTDRLPVEEYPEWLQMDAAHHARPRWGELALRALAGVALLGVVLATAAAVDAWQDLVRPERVAFGEAEEPVNP